MILRSSLALLALLCITASTGCSSLSCGADQRNLAELREGMSYEEVSQIMGCSGERISEHGLEPGEYATIEWAGPDSLLFGRTHAVFFDRRLLSVMTYGRGGFF
jgi:hypothetical protein